MGRWFLAGILLLIPSAGLSEDCVATRSGEWSDTSFNGPAWDPNGPCTADPSDTFDLGGFAIATNSDLTLDPSARIEGASGSWTIGATGQAVVKLPNGSDGIQLTGTARLTTRGHWASWGNCMANWANVSPDDSNVWRVGEVILCPTLAGGSAWEEDCEQDSTPPGSRNELLIYWDDSIYENAGVANDPDPCVDESLANLPASLGGTTRTWVVFRRPGDDFSDQSYENSQWYEILDHGTSGGGSWILLSITQENMARRKAYSGGVPAMANYREIIGLTAAADHYRGDTRLILTQNDSSAGHGISADNRYNGTWLYIKNSSRSHGISQLPILIGWTLAGTPKTVQIARAEGLASDLPSNTEVFLSRAGIRPNDPFGVVKPTILISASTTPADFAQLRLNGGDIDLHSTVLDQLQMVTSSSGSRAVALNYVHSRDPDSFTGAHVLLGPRAAPPETTTTFTVDIDYLNMVGTRTAGDNMHGLEIGSNSEEAPTTATGHVYDSSARYSGDDCFNDRSTETYFDVDLKRLWCSYSTETASSDQGLELAHTLGQGTHVSGVLCTDCGRGGSSLLLARAPDGPHVLDDVMSVGATRQGISGDTDSAVVTRFSYIASTHSAVWHGQRYRITGGVVARNRTTGTFGMLQVNPTTAAQGQWYLRDFLVYDNTTVGGGAAGEPLLAISGRQDRADSGVENALFLDNTIVHTANQYLIRHYPNGTPASTFNHYLRRITVAYSKSYRAAHPATFPVLTFVDAGIHSTFANWETLQLDGLLLTGHYGASVSSTEDAALFLLGTAGVDSVKNHISITHGPCFFDNVDDIAAGGTAGRNIDFRSSTMDERLLTTSDAAELTRHQALDLKDPLSRIFTPEVGGVAYAVGCGIRGDSEAPGIHSEGWTHYMTGIQPENAETVGPGPDLDGDGLTYAAEVSVHGTDPLVADTDADGLKDGAEVDVHKTDPLAADSDDDGFSDGAEVASGTDPSDPSSRPDLAVPALTTMACALATLLIALAAGGGLSRRRAWPRHP